MRRVNKISVGLVFGLVLQVFTGVISLNQASAATLVVAKDGSGSYKTVQAAVNAASSGDTIQIKSGKYEEQVSISKANLKIIGEGRTGTIITAGKNQEAAGSAEKAATVNISAQGVYVENVTFANTFDGNSTSSNQDQAQALFSNGDKQIYKNCGFSGRQDTIYNYSGRQYFYNCYVEGDVDFIYGPATVVFDSCQIHSLTRNSTSNNGYICAPATPASTIYGYLFYKCKLTSNCAAKTVKLGRTWKNDPQVLFRECELGAHISNDAWGKINTIEPSACDMFEYKNTGDGANLSRKQLDSSKESTYTVAKYLAGNDGWNPKVSSTSTPTPTNKPTSTPTPVQDYIYGDVNGDGVVDSGDFLLLRRHLMGLQSLTAQNWQITADLNRDNRIDTADYTILRRFLIRIVSKLPV